MYLALQITAPPTAMTGPNANKIFSESGGTIGRAAANDWVLQDDERFISGRHAIIRFMGGAFSLEDVSTNGTYINDATETVGSGNEPVVLKNGDRTNGRALVQILAKHHVPRCDRGSTQRRQIFLV